MTFREIIEAALKECGAMQPQHGETSPPPVACPWHPPWKWGDTVIDVYFYGINENPIQCSIYWYTQEILNIIPSELLDPNWSPEVLAKQIDDGIARIRAENDL